MGRPRVPADTFADATAPKRKALDAKQMMKRKQPREYYNSRPTYRKVFDALAFPGLAMLGIGSAIIIYTNEGFWAYLGPAFVLLGFFSFVVVYSGHRAVEFFKDLKTRFGKTSIQTKLEQNEQKPPYGQPPSLPLVTTLKTVDVGENQKASDKIKPDRGELTEKQLLVYPVPPYDQLAPKPEMCDTDNIAGRCPNNNNNNNNNDDADDESEPTFLLIQHQLNTRCLMPDEPDRNEHTETATKIQISYE